MEKVDLCIFDVDGLLLDTERVTWYIAQKKAARDMGLEIDDEFILSMNGKKVDCYEDIYKKHFGSRFSMKEYLKRMYYYYDEMASKGDIPILPGVKELLVFLKNNNILTSIGTCTDEKSCRLALEKLNLLNYFDYAVFGDNVKEAKPHPEIYEKSMKYFNIKPENCLIFEDSNNGAKTVFNAKSNLVLVPNAEEVTDEVKQKAFRVIKQIDEIIPTIKEINCIDK